MLAATTAPAGSGTHPGRDAYLVNLLRAVLERSDFVAAVTDAAGTIEWASPAFAARFGRTDDPVGCSLFVTAGTRGAELRTLLQAAHDAPDHCATADIGHGTADLDPDALVTCEDRCDDPSVRGVLWWQCGDSQRVERLTHALAHIAREVEWVGFGRGRPVTPAPAIGMLA